MEKKIENSKDNLENEELNFLSPKFNPLKALYSKDTVTPLKVRAFDNLAKCRFLLPKSDKNHLAKESLKPKESAKPKEKGLKKIETKVENEELNFLSPKFNPLKALYSKDTVTPLKVRALDNLAKCRFLLPKSDKNHVTKKTMKPKESAKPKEKSKKKIKEKKVNPLIEIMEDKSFESGPFKKLKDWQNNKIKVTVSLRGVRTIKSKCTGHILSFDKHLNLIMKNVEETFLDNNSTRNCPQLLIKGDNVVIISKYLPSK